MDWVRDDSDFQLIKYALNQLAGKCILTIEDAIEMGYSSDTPTVKIREDLFSLAWRIPNATSEKGS